MEWNWYSYQTLEDEYKNNPNVKSIKYTSAIIMLNVLWGFKDTKLRQFVKPVSDYQYPQVEYHSSMFRTILTKGTDTNAKHLLEQTGFLEVASKGRFNAGVYNRGQIIGIKTCEDDIIRISEASLNKKKLDRFYDWQKTRKKGGNKQKVSEETWKDFANMALALDLNGYYSYYNPHQKLTVDEYNKFRIHFNHCINMLQKKGRINFRTRLILNSLRDFDSHSILGD